MILKPRVSIWKTNVFHLFFSKHDFFCVCLILYLKPSPTDTVIGGCLIFLHITDELNNFPRLGIYSLYHFFHYYG